MTEIHFNSLQKFILESSGLERLDEKKENTTVLTRGCCKKLTPDEIYDILKECI